MILPVAIQFQAHTQQALTGIQQVGGGLMQLARQPLQNATLGFRQFGMSGTEVLHNFRYGLSDVETQWNRFTGMLGVPLSLGGVWGAVTGIKSMKTALIDTNAQMEMARTRMGSLIRDYDDTQLDGFMKAKEVTRWLEKYSIDTPFEIQGLTEAAVQGGNANIKNIETMKEFVKMSAKLAAGKGELDPQHAAYAIQAGMTGNTASLRYSYGLNVSDEMVNMIAANLGPNLAGTDTGRMLAIKRLIDMRYGKDEAIITSLANTGPGVMSTISDAIRTPIRMFGEPAYLAGVKGLVDLKDKLLPFVNSDTFLKFQDQMGKSLLPIGETFARGMRLIGDNLERLPEIWQKVSPVVLGVGKFAGGLLALNAAAFVVRGGLYLLTGTLLNLAKAAAPALAILTNPLLLLGTLAFTSALYPYAQGVQLAGRSVGEWADRLGELSEKKDWYKFFTEPLQLIKTFIGNLKDGQRAFSEFGTQASKTEFFKDLHRIVNPALQGFYRAARDAFPALDGFAVRLDHLQPYLPVMLKLAGGLLALTAASKALGVVMPLLMGASRIAGSLGMIGKGLATLASPGVLAVGAVGGMILYPLIRDLSVAGRTVDEWMMVMSYKVSRFDWTKFFSGPAQLVRQVFDGLKKISFDPMGFWQDVFSPRGFLGRVGQIFNPIWKGFLKAMDDAFPELQGWFSKFSNAGETAFKVLKTAGDLLLPVLKGMWDVLRPVGEMLLKVAGVIAGVAWDTISGGINLISGAIGSRNFQAGLEKFGTVLGQLTVAGGAIWALAKGLPLLQSTLGGIKSAFSSPMGRIGMSIAAATIIATMVQLHTNEIWDRTRVANVWNNVSGRKATDGQQSGTLFNEGLKLRYTNDTTRSESIASMLGVVQTLTNNRLFGDKFINQTGLSEADQKRYGYQLKGIRDAADSGNAMAQKLQLLYTTLTGEDSEGKLKGSDKIAFDAAKKAFGNLDALVDSGASSQEIAKAYDQYMRNMFYFATRRMDAKDLMPENLAERFLWMPEIKNPNRDSSVEFGGAIPWSGPSDVGGAIPAIPVITPVVTPQEVVQGAYVLPPMASASKDGPQVVIEKLEVPLTIYAETTQALDEEQLVLLLRRRLAPELQTILTAALQNQSR